MNHSRQAIQVALIANYPPDRQRSMKRFADLLSEGLEAQNVSVTKIHPPVVFGRSGSTTHGIGKWLGYIDKYLLAPFYLKRKLKRLPGNKVVHICDHSNAFYTSILQKEPHLVTCHDMLAVRSAHGEFPQNHVSLTGRLQQWNILNGLKRARHVACVSAATARDLSRLAALDPTRVTNIPNCLSPEFMDALEKAPSGGRTCEESPYLLHVGSSSWYKNRDAVLSVFKLMTEQRPDLRLHIVGPEFDPDAHIRTNTSQLVERIHYIDSPSDKELKRIYADAEILLFPSLIEGFGWPILEAQACGTPVLTCCTQPMSELNALPELCIEGDATTPAWHRQAAEACLVMIRKERDERIEIENTIRTFCGDFTVVRMATAYLEVYTSLLLAEVS